MRLPAPPRTQTPTLSMTRRSILDNGLEYAIATAVPEPSTLAMLGTGLSIILVYAWCRRRRTPVDI